MAKRGITTSTVGIGEGFSPLQLDALAEGGRGRVHVAATPDEIADVVIGEVLGTQAIVARDLKLKLRWPRAVTVRHLGHFESVANDTAITIALGDLANSSKRSVPFLVDVPALPLGTELGFEARVKAMDAATGEKLKAAKARTTLSIVSRHVAEAAERDLRVAERIGRLWESKVAFNAMSLNESGDFDAAVGVVAESESLLATFSEGTSLKDKVEANLTAMKARVSQQWDGISKREAMFLSKKLARSEADHRKKRDPDSDWSDHL